MKFEFNKHKKADSIKWGVVLLAVILLTVFVVAANTEGFSNWNPYGWFGEQEQVEDPTPEQELPELPDSPDVEQQAGVEIHNSPLMRMSATRTMTNDPMATSTNGITLTATVLPSTAVDKTVDWTVEFADPTDTWAEGKTASDYVSVIPASDGALTASVTAIEAFGAQVKIVVTSRANPEAQAYCLVDYGQRLSDTVNWMFYNSLFATSGELTNEFDVQLIEAIKVSNGEFSEEYLDVSHEFEINYNENFTVAIEEASVKLYVRASDEFFEALMEEGIGREEQEWADITECNLVDIFNGVTEAPLNDSAEGISAILGFNRAVMNADGEYDLEFKIVVATNFETKEYVIQCKFNKNGPAFTADSITLNMGNIVL